MFYLQQKNCHAFSLLELLMVIGLLSALILISVPALSHFVKRNRVVTQVQQIMRAVEFARSEAIKLNKPVMLCKSGDGKTCGGEWRDGQIIIVENKVLRVFSALPANDYLFWSSNLNRDAGLIMLPSGFTNGQNGSFYFCPADKQYAQRIVIEQSGRMRVTNKDVNCNSSS